MSRPSLPTAAPVARPRGRPRKTSLPPARFAPIDLTGAIDSRPMVAAVELLFPDGLTLRVSRDADPVAIEQFLSRLRHRMD